MIRTALLDAWAVVSPVTCAGCGADDRSLCAACRLGLVPRPHRHDTGGLLVSSSLVYEGRPRAAIIAFKEQFRTDIARALADPLRAAIIDVLAHSGDGPVELVSIPPSSASYRSRGFDPVALLVARARMPLSSRVLVHARSASAQKSLDRDRRESNRAFSLRARHPLGGRRFVVVDDVVTTGSTLREAARALTEAAAVVVGAATIAYTPRRSVDRENVAGAASEGLLNVW